MNQNKQRNCGVVGNLLSSPNMADTVERVVLLAEIEKGLRSRVAGIDGWLAEIGSSCKTDQRHCEEGTVERAYWHYGYAVAIKDVLDLLQSAAMPIN